jgi:hypothetical protein
VILYPPCLEVIFFGGDFNKSIDELPDTVICIILGHSYNKSLWELPPHLKYLTLGPYYDKILPAKLFPRSIKKIYIPRMNMWIMGHARPSNVFLNRDAIFANYSEKFKKKHLVFY